MTKRSDCTSLSIDQLFILQSLDARKMVSSNIMNFHPQVVDVTHLKMTATYGGSFPRKNDTTNVCVTCVESNDSVSTGWGAASVAVWQ